MEPVFKKGDRVIVASDRYGPEQVGLTGYVMGALQKGTKYYRVQLDADSIEAHPGYLKFQGPNVNSYEPDTIVLYNDPVTTMEDTRDYLAVVTGEQA